jgi:beta-lactamase regulating signal transducer with metallopeptidase domain
MATSALIVLVLVVREPVRGRFGSRVTYGLWLIPAARLFMPTLTETVERTVPAQVAFHPLPAPVVSESVWMARVTPVDPSLADRLGGWPTLLAGAWLAVAASLFLSRVIAFHRDRRAILASAVGIVHVGAVRIVRTPEVASPVALGLFDPLIAVPAEFERRYSERERRLVIEHELAHHRSGDLIANLFAFVLLCVQWFNPLAWVAHAAFRFDQEAACDARVLDKADAGNRADYGRAIAKAASGRALLFASALDRPTSLHRRLESMLRSPHPARHSAGRLIIVTAIAAALPLTASRAIEYVDIPSPAAPAAPSAWPSPAASAAVPIAPVPAAAAAAAAQPAAAVAPVPPRPVTPLRSFDGDLSINGGFVTIHGTTKRWKELTPAEKAEVRAAVAKARAGLANVHIDRDAMRDVGAAVSRIRIDEIQRDLQQAQAGASQALRTIDEHAPDLRRSGVDPERMKAELRAAQQSAASIDFDAMRQQLAAIDPRQLAQSLAAAEESVRKASAELDRIEARMGNEGN